MRAQAQDRPATVPRRGAHRFHPLTVASVQRLTDDAVAVTFDVPEEIAEDFRFVQGQHLTIRWHASGEEIRRNYSICSAAPDGPLRIAVKRLEGGSFSAFANEELRPGDVLDVMPPLGGFHVPLEPERARTHVAVAAGSGITPVLSLLLTTLATEPRSTCTLVYANRTAGDVMFLDELRDAKDRYPRRFQLLNVFSREHTDAPICNGRIDAAKLDLLFSSLVPPGGVDQWYLCGPFALVRLVRAALAERGVAEDRVHFELFHTGEGDEPAPRRRAHQGEAGGASRAVFTLGGVTSSVDVDTSADETVLGAVLRERGDAPFACRGGVCGTCRARVLGGEVDLARNFALEAEEIAAGYVLTCQSRPVTSEVVVDYDA
ncbi:ring-1,2-phenylacetyl-CoA epoxidase subunit PaaE [Lipingzhangella halophila]|uniref:Ring-1,2-phenylacetyl-CoA epoxidase subunit PaaE n=1 Tax=Lipingzhangella halophila TaxID=1783352 RepID=A0A7W7RDP7_9ACTN|nr:1,2-phenylacetyl-CoA epoxidase subunit PaaE [Lipingzhangella halophila]MBB4929501.1 ring-1,2-phenylacetyl-CoA epoxidase subunit PaaE [Lipingzhangella halophila]